MTRGTGTAKTRSNIQPCPAPPHQTHRLSAIAGSNTTVTAITIAHTPLHPAMAPIIAEVNEVTPLVIQPQQNPPREEPNATEPDSEHTIRWTTMGTAPGLTHRAIFISAACIGVFMYFWFLGYTLFIEPLLFPKTTKTRSYTDPVGLAICFFFL